MSSLCVTLVLALGLAVQDPSPAVVDAEKVKAAVAELNAAFEHGDAKERIQAIEKSAALAHPDVVAGIAKGLADESVEVQTSAIEALRVMAHPKAIEALHATYARDKKLRQNAELFAKLLRAIAQHASPSSIELLSEGVFAGDEEMGQLVLEARIIGLGNIRDVKSIDALMGLMRRAGRVRVQPHMQDFRLALIALTGVDMGADQDAWMGWWNEHKKGFEISPRLAPMSPEAQRKWNRFWGLEQSGQRGRKRGGDEKRG